MNRKSLSKFKRRFCIVCGNDQKLSRDHIVPRSAGGISSWINYMILCENCNQEKNSRDPIEWLNSLTNASKELEEVVRFAVRIHEALINGTIPRKKDYLGQFCLPFLDNLSCINCRTEPLPSYYKRETIPSCKQCRTRNKTKLKSKENLHA